MESHEHLPETTSPPTPAPRESERQGGDRHTRPRLSPTVAPKLNRELDDTELDRFVTVLKGFDEAALDAFVSATLRRGIGPERFLVELVAPAARAIGQQWHDDKCDFVDVTLATGRLQRVVRRLGSRITGTEGGSTADRPLVLLSSPVGHGHTLGMLIVAEFFQADGWSVALGAPFERVPAPDFVASHFTHVVGFSLSLTDGAPTLREEIRRVRRRSMNPSVGILVGGPAILEDPDLVDFVGADASTVDARLVSDVARAFL